MRRLAPSLFVIASALPLGLVGLGALAGGVWVWLALAHVALTAVALDMALPWAAPEEGEAEFPGADALLAGLALAGLVALPLVVWAVAGPSGLSAGQRAALFLGAGLWFGQVGHPAAHELIHRPRPLFWLGAGLYAALLFGHHASAHRLVHHRFVATPDDPNSAPEGESFYRFARRAWVGSFREGWRAERALRARAAGRRGLHPYVWQLGVSLAGLAMGLALAGWAGMLVWAGLGLHMGGQILLSDYVQHYGLTRGTGPDGRPLPVTEAHSWNTRHWFSSAMMLNAPRHSDHHAHPARPYPTLRLSEGAPVLPWPLPLAATLALFPRAWRRRMKPVLKRVRAQGLQAGQ